MILNLTTLLILTLSLKWTQSQTCVLPDAQGTPGTCSHIRDCKYQLGRLRVGSHVTRCGGKGHVCCPNTKSISEKKCAEWREMLHVPLSFSQSRLDQPLCANPEQLKFIVGGRNAEPFEYPHAVSLGYGTDPNKLKYQCGATLISERFLVTAAHCITNQRAGKPSYAVIGDVTLYPDRENGSPSPYRKVVKISQHIVHPDYKPPHIYNDIALLMLSTPLELSRYILPACLGSPTTTPVTTQSKHTEVEASGWGITDASSQKTSNILQAVNISTVDTKSCNMLYSLNPDKSYRYPEGIVKTQMCASGIDRDTCSGDSGGGLYIRQEKCIFHIVGVTSIGSRLCGEGSPAIYTTVASYQDWIESTVWGNSRFN